MLHGPKSPQLHHQKPMEIDLKPQMQFRDVPFCTACSRLILKLRWKAEAVKYPFTSLSQVTDFLLHLISGCQQMLFPQ